MKLSRTKCVPAALRYRRSLKGSQSFKFQCRQTGIRDPWTASFSPNYIYVYLRFIILCVHSIAHAYFHSKTLHFSAIVQTETTPIKRIVSHHPLPRVSGSVGSNKAKTIKEEKFGKFIDDNSKRIFRLYVPCKYHQKSILGCFRVKDGDKSGTARNWQNPFSFNNVVGHEERQIRFDLILH